VTEHLEFHPQPFFRRLSYLMNANPRRVPHNKVEATRCADVSEMRGKRKGKRTSTAQLHFTPLRLSNPCADIGDVSL
jgi:hypothetical protein